jgi:ATP-dependent exoDNAse (exonuclease V) alpha subunit
LQASQRAQLTDEEQATLERLVRAAAAGVAGGDCLSQQPRLQLAAAVTASLPGQRQTRGAVRPEPNLEIVKAAIDYARDHLFERNSVVGQNDLLAEALKFSRGTVDLPALKAELRRRTEFIAVGDTLTTKEALRQEQRLIAFVNQGLDGCRPLHPGFIGSPKLTAEQQQALQFILRSPDEVIALRGHAGTGKTRLLRELVRGIEERYAAVVLAPMAAAVEVLREQGFKQAATVQRFLADPDFQQRAAGKALIVDEAGFLSLRDLLAVVEAARTLRCRLILSGDTRQHHGVEAGDALRLLEVHSSLRTVQIQNIQRQVDREYRAAIGELANGQGQEALRRLERLGAVHEVEDETRYQHLANAYAASVKAGKSALAVSPTWREIEQVTTEVRARLKTDGRLALTETEVTTHHGLKWTRAQKRDLRNYKPGLVLTFHKATKDFRANEWGELTSIEGDNLQLVKPDGTTARVSRKQADCFEVAEKQKLPVAVGERLLLQGNRKADRLFNGQIVTVEVVHPDGSLSVDGKRTIAPDFRAFTYGYCVTSHASQGRTVDHVLVAVNSETTVAANLSQFYVSASRGSDQVQIYTDDLDFLRQAVQRSGTRLSATELVESVRLAARESVKPRPQASQRQAV